MGRRTEVEAEMRALESNSESEEDLERSDWAVPAFGMASGLLLAISNFDPILRFMLARFVSFFVVISAVIAVSISLMEISEVRVSGRGNVFKEIVVVSCFVTSTIPFTLPWALAYFFPIEFLYFLTAASLAVETVARVLTLCAVNARQRTICTRRTPKERDIDWCRAFILVQSTIVFLASVVAMFWELAFVQLQKESEFSWALLFAILLLGVGSMAMFLQGFWLTYAIGGRWLHHKQGWCFFQPFRGGSQFIVLQALCWSLYGVLTSAAVDRLAPAMQISLGKDFNLPIVSQALSMLTGLSRWTGISTLPAGTLPILFVATHFLLVLSLHTFEGDESSKNDSIPSFRLRFDEKLRAAIAESTVVEREEKEGILISFLKDFGRSLLLMIVMIGAIKPEIVLGLIAFAVSSFAGDLFTTTGILVAVALLYLQSYSGKPELIGSRNSDGPAKIYSACEDHFHLRTIRLTEKEWDPEHEYIVGYHPHGLFPSAAAYAKRTLQFRALFPRINLFTLTASIIHVVPVLKDFAQSSGSLEVSKRGFWAALNRFRGVLIVPGGQGEMLLNYSNDESTEMISTKHKGFIKLAIRRATLTDRKVFLVPCFAFGDRKTVQNLSVFPLWLQKLSVRLLRTNVAFLPIGRLGLPLIPRREPVSVVFGEPIEVHPLKTVDAFPTEEQVELYRRFFYTQLEKSFDTFKAIHGNGYELASINFLPPLQRLKKSEFTEKLEEANEDFVEGDHDNFLRDIDENAQVCRWKEAFVAGFVAAIAVLPPVFLSHPS